MILTEKTKNLIWSALAMVPSAFVCLGYVLYKRDFAKFHIEFSYFDFPIFVGEILLFFCVTLFVFRWLRHQSTFFNGKAVIKKYYLFAVLYVAWLLFKAISGYGVWGPLAFRHAALFYYPLFFLIGYVFFNRDLFTRWTVPLLLAVIITVFLRRQYDHYWTFTLAALGLVLILATKDKRIRGAMLAMLLVAIPYVLLFKTSRMMFVANVMSIMFLMASVVHVWKVKLHMKLAFVIVFSVFLTGVFYKFFVLGESGRVFVPPSTVISTFQHMDQSVQNKKNDYERAPLPVGLYNPPNAASRRYHYYNQDFKDILIEGDDEIMSTSTSMSTPTPMPLLEEKPSDFVLLKLVSGKDQGTIIRDSMTKEEKEEETIAKTAEVFEESPMPVEWTSLNNIVFRLFIWRDMFVDWREDKSPLLGIDFGKPLRSVSLEILSWCESEWNRDGWIEPHNSFFHILYRGGVIGVVFVALMVWALVRFMVLSWRRKSWLMILLASVLLNWLVASNFLLILELPYTAIPFWLLAGMSCAYVYSDMNIKKEDA